MRRGTIHALRWLLLFGGASLGSWAQDESHPDIAELLARAQSDPNADDPFLELHAAPRDAVLDELARSPIDLGKRPYAYIAAYYRLLGHHQAAARPELRNLLYATLRDPNWGREAAAVLGRAPPEVLPEVIAHLVDALSPDALAVGSSGLRGGDRDLIASNDRQFAAICSAAIRRNLEQLDRDARAAIVRTLRTVTTSPSSAIDVSGALLATEIWIAIRSGSRVEAELESLRERSIELRIEVLWELLVRGNEQADPPELASQSAWEFRRETCRQIRSIPDPKLRAQALLYCSLIWPQARRFQDGRVVFDPEFRSLVRSFLIDTDPLVVSKARVLLHDIR